MKDTRTPEDVFLGVPAPPVSDRWRDMHPVYRLFAGIAMGLALIGVYKFVTGINWHSYLNGTRTVLESNPYLMPVRDYEAVKQRWLDKEAARPKKKVVTTGSRAGEPEQVVPPSMRGKRRQPPHHYGPHGP